MPVNIYRLHFTSKEFVSHPFSSLQKKFQREPFLRIRSLPHGASVPCQSISCTRRKTTMRCPLANGYRLGAIEAILGFRVKRLGRVLDPLAAESADLGAPF
jgi:hypothetical protein